MKTITTKQKRTVLMWLLGLIAVVIIIVSFLYYWHYSRIYPRTEDAFIKRESIYVAPVISGKLTKLLVHNQQFVHQGQLLFVIDPKPFSIELKKAINLLKKALSDLHIKQMYLLQDQVNYQQKYHNQRFAHKELERYQELRQKQFVSTESLDNKLNQYRLARTVEKSAATQLKIDQQAIASQQAYIESLRQDIAKSHYYLRHTQVKAAANGYISNLTIQVGDVAVANKILFQIVKLHAWVRAYYKETQLDLIKVGNPATVYLDMYANKRFKGRVLSIGPSSTTSFSILPSQNNAGNWVKVTQRFPVLVSIDNPENLPLREGASVTVKIDTTQKLKR